MANADEISKADRDFVTDAAAALRALHREDADRDAGEIEDTLSVYYEAMVDWATYSLIKFGLATNAWLDRLTDLDRLHGRDEFDEEIEEMREALAKQTSS
ncbi:MAG: hypothetical protein Q605_AUC01139G0001 [Actinomyces urogenitalis DORA_12]|uniref:Uncharacterized protein n=2 Tax=root TaxID=1 RepID=W1V4Y3_9ACTO|nr:MAG: hypothetical protein Q605_AUC01139G0001 [Actinomyces urogenitalis DORA_12]